MTSLRKRSLAAFVAGLAALGSASAAEAVTTTVTGLSDQNMANTDSASGGWTTAVDSYQAALSTSSANGQITQARYQVRWDIALVARGNPSHPDVVYFDNWLARAAAKGLRPLITFQQQNPSSEDPAHRIRPPVPIYATAVADFLATARWSAARDFTPWNEPNHRSYWVSPAQAAGYYDALVTACAGTCTIAAGDFAGTDSSDLTYGYPYFRDYVTELHNLSRFPVNWAYHPYEVVNSNTRAGLDRFLGDIGTGKRIWFTEVGAYWCRGHVDYSATQAESARRLKSLMESAAYFSGSGDALDRVYYYMLSGSGPRTPGGICTWDTALLHNAADGGVRPRPAMAELFPKVSGGRLWAKRNSHSTGVADEAQWFVAPGIPVAGDWDGDGIDTPGTFDPATGWWYLTNSTTFSWPEIRFEFGAAGHRPVVGDWNGDGYDSIGVVDGNLWYLRNSNSSGPIDYGFQYGEPSNVPVVGDWDGNNSDTPGMVAGAIWFLRNSNSTGVSDIAWFEYGTAGDNFLAADWDRSGNDTPGVVSQGSNLWFLKVAFGSGPADVGFTFGSPGDRPVVGDWNGDGYETAGVVQ